MDQSYVELQVEPKRGGGPIVEVGLMSRYIQSHISITCIYRVSPTLLTVLTIVGIATPSQDVRRFSYTTD